MHKPGFSFIEAILALAIVGLVVTPIIILVTNIVRTNTRAIKRIDYNNTLYNFMIECLANQATERIEKNITSPTLKVTYQEKEVPEKFPIPMSKGLVLARATAVDAANPKQEHAQLITFVYHRPPPEPKDKQQAQKKGPV